MVKPAEATGGEVRVIGGALFGRVGVLKCPCGCGALLLMDTSDDGDVALVPGKVVEDGLLAIIRVHAAAARESKGQDDGGQHAG